MSEINEILKEALAGIRKTERGLVEDIANDKFTAFEATRLSLELTNQVLTVHKVYQYARIADALEGAGSKEPITETYTKRVCGIYDCKDCNKSCLICDSYKEEDDSCCGDDTDPDFTCGLGIGGINCQWQPKLDKPDKNGEKRIIIKNSSFAESCFKIGSQLLYNNKDYIVIDIDKGKGEAILRSLDKVLVDKV